MGKQKIALSTNSTLIPLFICLFCCYCYTSESIEAEEGYDPLLQLPRLGSGTLDRLTHNIKVFDVTDFGAKGDGLTDDTEVFSYVWKKACSSYLKSTILLPAGSIFLLRPIDFGGPCQAKLTLRPCHHAPRVLTFHKCHHIKVKDITIVDSQQMHLAFTNCFAVEALHLKVLAPEYSPNTDGIHISSSSYVKIEDSIIKTGDDCISIVGNSSVIQIRNIYCGPGHGISIGSLGKSNSSMNVRDVKVKEAFFSNTENGVRIKTWQGGDGIASEISFENIWMDNVSNPIIIDQYYCDSPITCENQTLAVKVKDISFVGIKGTSATDEAITFACSDTYPCERLYVEDIQLAPSSKESSLTSFCWQARGSFSGLVYPSPCFSNNGSVLKQIVHSSNVS